MKLHIFNPEHDLALAANQSNYTAPHAGRQLRNDLSFIPALWADEGDFVLVDDIDCAQDKVRHLGDIYINKVEFITKLQLREVFKDTFLVDSVHPWGWDKAIVSELKAIGCPDIMLPPNHVLDSIRNLSSRRWAAQNLQRGTVFADSTEALRHAIANKGNAVVKAPWSSSGRGVRYVSTLKETDSSANKLSKGGDLEACVKWAANIIKHQGGVTVEPYYNKVKDFGMEFEVKDGKVAYRGLSLFQTIKGAYTGNLLATEEDKEALLSAYVSHDELTTIRQTIISKMEPVVRNIYSGPFGVDMMVYSDGKQTLVNPCVEVNLRRTMGHVALDMGLSDKASRHLMRVDYDGNRYHLRVLPGEPSEDAPFH